MIATTLLWLILNVYHESRGATTLEQQAIVHVTLNRSKKEDKPIHKVIKSKGQFSWTKNKKNLKKKPWIHDKETFFRCSINTIKALNNKDITNGAIYFHDKSVKPRWTKSMIVTKRTNKFIFYKERA